MRLKEAFGLPFFIYKELVMRFSEMTYIKPNILLKIIESPTNLSVGGEDKKEVLYTVTLLKKSKNGYAPAYYEECGEAFDNSPVEMYLDAVEVEEVISFVKSIEEEPEFVK